MQSRREALRARLAVGPRTYSRIAFAALVALTVIVFTGAAVRVTGSGLGCPEWPRCTTETLTPTEVHAPVVIEFGNRMLTFLVTAASLAALIFAWSRRPFRRDLLLLAAVLPRSSRSASCSRGSSAASACSSTSTTGR
jgi:heme a synthase